MGGYFSKNELILINDLITSQKWIEEEAFDLVGMINVDVRVVLKTIPDP